MLSTSWKSQNKTKIKTNKQKKTTKCVFAKKSLLNWSHRELNSKANEMYYYRILYYRHVCLAGITLPVVPSRQKQQCSPKHKWLGGDSKSNNVSVQNISYLHWTTNSNPSTENTQLVMARVIDVVLLGDTRSFFCDSFPPSLISAPQCFVRSIALQSHSLAEHWPETKIVLIFCTADNVTFRCWWINPW